MKKSIKDLTENDVIATPTLEGFQAVKKLFPKIDMSDSCWDVYKEEACINTLGRDGRGQYAPLSYYQSKGNPIHSLTDFIEYEPPFNPKFGDLVIVDFKDKPRIFLFEKNKEFHCVYDNQEELFRNGKNYSVSVWNKIYPYNPPSITITPEQAIEKLKQLPEFTNQEIKIEG